MFNKREELTKGTTKVMLNGIVANSMHICTCVNLAELEKVDGDVGYELAVIKERAELIEQQVKALKDLLNID